MTDSELLSLNQLGFIPGPLESEEAFTARVAKIKASIVELNALPRSQWDWAKERLQNLFGFDPQCLPVFYSNKNLAIWQGAACWIDEDNIPILQFRNGFKKGRYLKIYSREEVLAHEAIHAARSAFDEEENEEFFAYASSAVKWRSILGPLLKRPWEAWVAMILVACGVFFWWATLLAATWIGMGFWRLCRQHLRLSRAALFLQSKFKQSKVVRSVLFRLTDREIRGLEAGIWPEGDESLRWRVIRLAYFS